MRTPVPLHLYLTVIILQAVHGFVAVPDSTELGRYHVKENAVSVSGLSSGAIMAVQYHAALSSHVMGLGVVAGVPYGCPKLEGMSVTLCMESPGNINTQAFIDVAQAASTLGTIDNTSNMANDKIFVFSGQLDSVVDHEAGRKLVEFYHYFIPNHENVQYKFDLQAEHGMPTLNYGSACEVFGGYAYLMNCHYSVAFHILNHIYGGNLHEPAASTPQNGKLLEFDQSKFFNISNRKTNSMDAVGCIYVPSRCDGKTTECKLHIAFHGCMQGRHFVGDTFARHAGYNEVGELNNIIILYPQVTTAETNPYGCWDWWGYTGMYYDTKAGSQIMAVRKMMGEVMKPSNYKLSAN